MKKILIGLILLLSFGSSQAQWTAYKGSSGFSLYSDVYNSSTYLQKSSGLFSGGIMYAINGAEDTSKYNAVRIGQGGLYEYVTNKTTYLSKTAGNILAKNVYIMNLDELLGSYPTLAQTDARYLFKSDSVNILRLRDTTLISTKQNVLNQIWSYVGDTSTIAHLNHNENVTGRWSVADLWQFNDTVIATDVKYTSLRTTPQTITNDTVFATNGSVFTKTLSASITVKLSGLADGQIITVALTNTASNYTVAWSALNSLTLVWSGGSAPTQTTGAKTDFYSFQRIGNNIYGAAVQNF